MKDSWDYIIILHIIQSDFQSFGWIRRYFRWGKGLQEGKYHCKKIKLIEIYDKIPILSNMNYSFVEYIKPNKTQYSNNIYK